MAATGRDVVPVRVPASNGVELDGDLGVPAGSHGVVAFAHGSGSSRLSPRNRAVAEALRDARIATLLVDLLTPAEERAALRPRQFRFDLDLLTGRLLAVVQWLKGAAETATLPMGLF